MTFYRSYITKTLEAYLEFDEQELKANGFEGDPDAFAWSIVDHMRLQDWMVANTSIDTEDFDGELPELS